MTFLRLLESIRTPFLDKLAMIITNLGSETVVMLVAALIYWCMDRRRGYRFMVVNFYAMALTMLLKGICAVPRPWVKEPSFTTVEGAQGTAEDFSFPSGHSTVAAGLYGSLAHAAKKRWQRIASVVLALLIAFSRMYVGVHTPQDVAVGLLIGFGAVVLLNRLLERAEKNTRSLLLITIGVSVLNLAAILVAWLRPAANAVEAACCTSIIRDTASLLGVSLALPVALLCERYIPEEPAQTGWLTKLLKVVVGLVLLMAIRVGLKAVLPTAPMFNTLRYFVVMLFATIIWPMTFPWFSRLTGGK